MATQIQIIGNDILSKLHFEILPSMTPDGKPIFGGEQKFKATDKTVDYVRKLQEEDRVLVLNSEGEVRVEDGSDAGSPDLPR